MKRCWFKVGVIEVVCVCVYVYVRLNCVIMLGFGMVVALLVAVERLERSVRSNLYDVVGCVLHVDKSTVTPS